jgi:hypothetical protein
MRIAFVGKGKSAIVLAYSGKLPKENVSLNSSVVDSLELIKCGFL